MKKKKVSFIFCFFRVPRRSGRRLPKSISGATGRLHTSCNDRPSFFLESPDVFRAARRFFHRNYFRQMATFLKKTFAIWRPPLFRTQSQRKIINLFLFRAIGVPEMRDLVKFCQCQEYPNASKLLAATTKAVVIL